MYTLMSSRYGRVLDRIRHGANRGAAPSTAGESGLAMAVFSTVLVAALAAGSAPGPAHAATVAVTIGDVRAADGALLVQVFDGRDGFEGRAEPAAQRVLEATPPAVTFELDLAPGVYGFRVMHDLDDDMEMDTNLVGMPQEPWGFSNNATGRFGPPGWDDVRFEVGEAPVEQSTDLIH